MGGPEDCVESQGGSPAVQFFQVLGPRLRRLWPPRELDTAGDHRLEQPPGEVEASGEVQGRPSRKNPFGTVSKLRNWESKSANLAPNNSRPKSRKSKFGPAQIAVVAFPLKPTSKGHPLTPAHSFLQARPSKCLSLGGMQPKISHTAACVVEDLQSTSAKYKVLGLSPELCPSIYGTGRIWSIFDTFAWHDANDIHIEYYTYM